MKEWIKAHHYLGSTPPGFVFLLEFRDGKRRIGAMQIGRPTARQYDADCILELNRMYFVDDTPNNAESQALGLMRKFVRTWYPSIKLLIAYSDPEVGHKGTIYMADGWAPFGMTDGAWGYGWKSRENRRARAVSKKQRWVRTP